MAQPKKLLTKSEVEICRKMASLKGLHGKRAKALLAINDGDTHRVAAEKAGLSGGQMMYLARIFHKNRIAIFPVDEPVPTVGEAEKEAESQLVEEPVQPSREVEELSNKKKDKKKKKKDKKKDKKKNKKKKSKKKKDKKKSDKKAKKAKKKKKSKKKK